MLVSVIGALLASGLRAAEQPRQVVGTHHDLWPKQGKTNAPRILQEVEGDFAVQVKVASTVKNGDRLVNEQLRPLKDAPTVLRLERRGGSVSASFSQDDGQSWKAFGQKTIHFSSRLKAGVAALNATDSPFSVPFSAP